MIYRDAGVEEIEEKLNEGIKKMRENVKKEAEDAINKSTYNTLYKKIRLEKEEDNYWKKDNVRGEDKEMWARIRCGNLGRAGKKGYRDWSCRGCGKEEETLIHLLKCEGIYKGVEKEKELLEEWRGLEDKKVEEKMIAKLKGEVDIKLCTVFKRIEEILRVNSGLRSVVQAGYQDCDVQKI